MNMSNRKIRLVLPKGRMHDTVRSLLGGAGLQLPASQRNYRPHASDPTFQVKLMRAANIPTLVEMGAHDVGFTGLDWVLESGAKVETVLDTGLLPVRIVSAAPVGTRPFKEITGRPIVVASEYENLAADYMRRQNVDWRLVRTYGATEVFPPDDADLIVDNTATESTLAANRLAVLDELLTSSTLFIANRESMRDPFIRERLEDLALLMRSVLDAGKRALLEMNVPGERLEQVVALLPAMKSPTVQPLYGNGEFAVKAAVPREAVPKLVPILLRAGARDILETEIQRVIS